MVVESTTLIALPQLGAKGGMALERAIAKRRSIREFESGSVSPAQLAQLLWATQGVTHPYGLRAVPSAGAL